MTRRAGTLPRRGSEPLRALAGRLGEAGLETPLPDARWLLARAETLAGDRDGAVTGAILDGLVARREQRVPVQQIAGATWFRHLRLVCRPGVFIPRPETEIVAGLAVGAAGRATAAPTVVDVGTGTGAIALSVAAEVPGARVVATERARVARTTARLNRALLAAGRAGPARPAEDATVAVVSGNLLGGVPAGLRGGVDVLVSNPPYLPAADRDGWAPEVADHDPADALIGGDDGLEVVGALLEAAVAWLRPGGTVIVEIDERRGARARALAEAAGLVDVRLAPDLNGADRAVVARRPAEGGGS